jgi:hypothetical protein
MSKSALLLATNLLSDGDDASVAAFIVSPILLFVEIFKGARITIGSQTISECLRLERRNSR